MVSKPFPVSERYNFFTRLWFWVIRDRIRKRNSLAFRALKNVISDRDEKKKQNKTEQETESKELSTKKYGTVWCKKKKKMISERFEGRAILAARITSEFKMAVMLSSNTLLTCSVIVLLRQIDFTSSRLFIWPAMFALKLAWTVGGGRWGEGAGKKILSTRSPKLRQFWRLMRFELFLII